LSGRALGLGTSGLLDSSAAWSSEDMTEAVRELVHRFETMPEHERQQVLAELLRRAKAEPHDLPDDQDLTAAADRLFQDLGRRERER
jgi:hypothetical protein